MNEMNQLGKVPSLSITSLAIHDSEVDLEEISGWSKLSNMKYYNGRSNQPFVTDYDLDYSEYNNTTNKTNRRRKRGKKKTKIKMKHDKNIGKFVPKKGCTFGGCKRDVFPLSPFKDVDTNINLLDNRLLNIWNSTTNHSNVLPGSSSFQSKSLRFKEYNQRRHQYESGHDKKKRLIEEHIEESNRSNIDPSIRKALKIMKESLLVCEKIDQECDKLNNDIQIPSNRRIRPKSAAVTRRILKSTFGVGKQRCNRLYNSVMPRSFNSFTNTNGKLTDSIMVSSFIIKRPNRPSPNYISQSPRSNNVKEAMLVHPTTVPTVISLKQRDQKLNTASPGQHKKKLKEILQEQFSDKRVEDLKLITAPTNVNLSNKDNSISPVNRKVVTRPKSAGITRFRIKRLIQNNQQSNSSSTKTGMNKRAKRGYKRPVSAMERSRQLAVTKAKFKTENKRLYQFDDWMQSYVIPRSTY
jgi:hypothetical protein